MRQTRFLSGLLAMLLLFISTPSNARCDTRASANEPESRVPGAGCHYTGQGLVWTGVGMISSGAMLMLTGCTNS